MPANFQGANCFRGCWVTYDLTYVGSRSTIASMEMLDELERDRRDCQYFFRYEPGLTPSAHIERQAQVRRDWLQWVRGLGGGIIGALIMEGIRQWLATRR